MNDILKVIFKSPILIALTAVLLIAALIVGVVVLTVFKLWMAFLLGGTLLIFALLMAKFNILPKEKYPWAALALTFLPIIGFFGGMALEWSGAFYIPSLNEVDSPASPYYSATGYQSANAQVTILLLIILFVCLALAFVKRK